MSPEEAVPSYEELLPLLRSAGLAWVAEEISEEVSRGKVLLPVYVGKKPDVWVTDYASEMGLLEKNDVAVEPYSDSERLDIAIAAIRNAVQQGVLTP